MNNKEVDRKRPWWARFVGSDDLASTDALLESLRQELDRLMAEVADQKRIIDAVARQREADEYARRERETEHEMALDALRAALRKEQEAVARARATREGERARTEAEVALLRQKAVDASRQLDARLRAAEQERAVQKAEVAAARAAALHDGARARAEAKEDIDQRDARIRALEKERQSLVEELGRRTADRDRLQDLASKAQIRHESELKAVRDSLQLEREKQSAERETMEIVVAEERASLAAELASALEEVQRMERARDEATAACARLEAEAGAARARAAKADEAERAASVRRVATLERQREAIAARCAELEAELGTERGARSAAELSSGLASSVAVRFARVGARALRLSFGSGASLPLRRALRTEIPSRIAGAPGSARSVESAASWLESSLRCAGMCESVIVRDGGTEPVLDVTLPGAATPESEEAELWIGELVFAALSGITSNLRRISRPDGAKLVSFSFERV